MFRGVTAPWTHLGQEGGHGTSHREGPRHTQWPFPFFSGRSSLTGSQAPSPQACRVRPRARAEPEHLPRKAIARLPGHFCQLPATTCGALQAPWPADKVPDFSELVTKPGPRWAVCLACASFILLPGDVRWPGSPEGWKAPEAESISMRELAMSPFAHRERGWEGCVGGSGEWVSKLCEPVFRREKR